jgi:dihydroorotate dehydrogenase
LWKEVSITSSDYKFLGEKIKNPIGLASGYDIDGEMIIGL